MVAKQLSGAAKRKLAKQRRDEERARAAARTEQETGHNPGPHISQVGPPPINDPIGAMLWCNNVLLVCMQRVLGLTDTEMPLEQRLRFLMDGCAKAGMIRDKSAESKAMLEALRKKDQKKEAAGLEPNASRSDPPKIPRPAG